MTYLRARQAQVGRCQVPQLGQAKVGNFHAALPVEEDVLGLDVAMYDALVVSVLEGVAHLCHDADIWSSLSGTGLHQLPQVLAGHELHHEVAEPSGLAKVVDSDDIRVIEPGQGTRLAAEALGESRVASNFWRQHLDGHQAVERGLPRPVDRSHAPLSEHSRISRCGKWWARSGGVGGTYPRS